jgi:predicted lipid carrier protein YhbT
MIRLPALKPENWRLPLLVPLRVLPPGPHTALIARVCNHLLRGQAIAERLGGLNGKTLCLRVTDVPQSFYFRIRDNRLHRAQPGPFDVRMSGKLIDFLQLAARAEDPDTLFFQRRLSIEGDTETGLHLKNLLDAVEFDWRAHVRAVLGTRGAAWLVPLLARLEGQRTPPSAPR